MNIKLITKAMHTLSLLSEDDVQMVLKLRGLSEDERQMLMLVLEPGTKPSKKSSKKSVGKGGGKSKHASSLAEKVGGTLASIAKTVDGDDEGARKVLDAIGEGSSERCHFTRSDGKLCLLLPDHNIHHMKTANEYHEFQPQSAEQAAASGG